MTKPKLKPGLKFNAWSQRRIREGRKFCTSRNYQVLDENVLGMVMLPWWFIKGHLYSLEGADSPEELQRVINQIQRRIVGDNEFFWVHFGEFAEQKANRRKP